MSDLRDFLEYIPETGFKAYRLDDTTTATNLKKVVGIDSCHSCDYFLFGCNEIILIEETRLLSSVRSIKREYSYLNDSDKEKIVNSKLIGEFVNKVYGTMLTQLY